MAEIDILYYGRFRDEIGCDRERFDPPSHVVTVADLVTWLRDLGGPHALAFSVEADAMRAVIADQWAAPGDSIFGVSEIALLPRVGVL